MATATAYARPLHATRRPRARRHAARPSLPLRRRHSTVGGSTTNSSRSTSSVTTVVFPPVSISILSTSLTTARRARSLNAARTHIYLKPVHRRSAPAGCASSASLLLFYPLPAAATFLQTPETAPQISHSVSWSSGTSGGHSSSPQGAHCVSNTSSRRVNRRCSHRADAYTTAVSACIASLPKSPPSVAAPQTQLALSQSSTAKVIRAQTLFSLAQTLTFKLSGRYQLTTFGPCRLRHRPSVRGSPRPSIHRHQLSYHSKYLLSGL